MAEASEWATASEAYKAGYRRGAAHVKSERTRETAAYEWEIVQEDGCFCDTDPQAAVDFAAGFHAAI
jgi:hypothetical protein